VGASPRCGCGWGSAEDNWRHELNEQDTQRPLMLAATLPAPFNLAAIASDGAVCLQWEKPRVYQLGCAASQPLPLNRRNAFGVAFLGRGSVHPG
jgi:hypothetical protein